MFRFYFSLLAFILSSDYAFAQDAVYSLDFISNWNSTTHPTDYPSAAHWSTLVGATHNNSISFWDFGQLASPGVEDVAELGDRTNITLEVNTSIADGNAYQLLELPLGFGSIFSFESISVDANFPYISLMTMLAPSPDWLAEIHNVKLTDASGNWLPTITINVYTTDT
ncbi:MAG: sporulation protein SpoOM, partial [Chlorobi bacterium]|nr:sporulation protein SpoOM [Chlorobiota bacterium]